MHSVSKLFLYLKFLSVSEVAMTPIYMPIYSTIIVNLVPFDASHLLKFMSDREEIVYISCMNYFKLKNISIKWAWKYIYEYTYYFFFEFHFHHLIRYIFQLKSFIQEMHTLVVYSSISYLIYHKNLSTVLKCKVLTKFKFNIAYF